MHFIMNRIFLLFYVLNTFLLHVVTSSDVQTLRKHGCLGPALISSESDGNSFHAAPAYRMPFNTRINDDNNYAFRLAEPLTVGQTVRILGDVRTNFDFGISLVKDAPKSDGSVLTVFHMRVRLWKGETVFNTAKNGNWEHEEKIGNPFTPGQLADIQFRAVAGKFEIYLNKEKKHEFIYRYGLENIEYLVIERRLKVEKIPIINGRRAVLPWKMDFPDHFLHEREYFRVSGIATGRNGFNVNLFNKKGDIIFYFGVDFNNNIVRRNTFINGVWQSEENHAKNPFVKDGTFDLEIVNRSYGIIVFVDGEYFTFLEHRTPDSTSDYVKIELNEFELTAFEVCVLEK